MLTIRSLVVQPPSVFLSLARCFDATTLSNESSLDFCISATLYCNGKQTSIPYLSPFYSYYPRNTFRLMNVVDFPHPDRVFPTDSGIVITIWTCTGPRTIMPIATTTLPLFSRTGRPRMGVKHVPLVPVTTSTFSKSQIPLPPKPFFNDYKVQVAKRLPWSASSFITTKHELMLLNPTLRHAKLKEIRDEGGHPVWGDGTHPSVSPFDLGAAIKEPKVKKEGERGYGAHRQAAPQLTISPLAIVSAPRFIPRVSWMDDGVDKAMEAIHQEIPKIEVEVISLEIEMTPTFYDYYSPASLLFSDRALLSSLSTPTPSAGVVMSYQSFAIPIPPSSSQRRPGIHSVAASPNMDGEGRLCLDLPTLRLAESLGITSVPPSQAFASENNLKQLHYLSNLPPTEGINETQRRAIWVNRATAIKYPSLLYRFVQSVNWRSKKMRLEAIDFLRRWESPSLWCLLELVSTDVAETHPFVRVYATAHLARLADDDLIELLPQLVQSLLCDNLADSQSAGGRRGRQRGKYGRRGSIDSEDGYRHRHGARHRRRKGSQERRRRHRHRNHHHHRHHRHHQHGRQHHGHGRHHRHRHGSGSGIKQGFDQQQQQQQQQYRINEPYLKQEAVLTKQDDMAEPTQLDAARRGSGGGRQGTPSPAATPARSVASNTSQNGQNWSGTSTAAAAVAVAASSASTPASSVSPDGSPASGAAGRNVVIPTALPSATDQLGHTQQSLQQQQQSSQQSHPQPQPQDGSMPSAEDSQFSSSHAPAFSAPDTANLANVSPSLTYSSGSSLNQQQQQQQQGVQREGQVGQQGSGGGGEEEEEYEWEEEDEDEQEYEEDEEAQPQAGRTEEPRLPAMPVAASSSSSATSSAIALNSQPVGVQQTPHKRYRSRSRSRSRRHHHTHRRHGGKRHVKTSSMNKSYLSQGNGNLNEKEGASGNRGGGGGGGEGGSGGVGGGSGGGGGGGNGSGMGMGSGRRTEKKGKAGQAVQPGKKVEQTQIRKSEQEEGLVQLFDLLSTDDNNEEEPPKLADELFQDDEDEGDEGDEERMNSSEDFEEEEDEDEDEGETCSEYTSDEFGSSFSESGSSGYYSSDEDSSRYSSSNSSSSGGYSSSSASASSSSSSSSSYSDSDLSNYDSNDEDGGGASRSSGSEYGSTYTTSSAELSAKLKTPSPSQSQTQSQTQSQQYSSRTPVYQTQPAVGQMVEKGGEGGEGEGGRGEGGEGGVRGTKKTLNASQNVTQVNSTANQNGTENAEIRQNMELPAGTERIEVIEVSEYEEEDEEEEEFEYEEEEQPQAHKEGAKEANIQSTQSMQNQTADKAAEQMIGKEKGEKGEEGKEGGAVVVDEEEGNNDAKRERDRRRRKRRKKPKKKEFQPSAFFSDSEEDNNDSQQNQSDGEKSSEKRVSKRRKRRSEDEDEEEREGKSEADDNDDDNEDEDDDDDDGDDEDLFDNDSLLAGGRHRRIREGSALVGNAGDGCTSGQVLATGRGQREGRGREQMAGGGGGGASGGVGGVGGMGATTGGGIAGMKEGESMGMQPGSEKDGIKRKQREAGRAERAERLPSGGQHAADGEGAFQLSGDANAQLSAYNEMAGEVTEYLVRRGAENYLGEEAGLVWPQRGGGGGGEWDGADVYGERQEMLLYPSLPSASITHAYITSLYAQFDRDAPLATLLFSRATQNLELFIPLFWLIHMLVEESLLHEQATLLMRALLEKMRQEQPLYLVYAFRQRVFFETISAEFDSVVKLKRTQKISHLRAISEKFFSMNHPFPSPVNPSYFSIFFYSQKLSVYKSKVQPVQLPFYTVSTSSYPHHRMLYDEDPDSIMAKILKEEESKPQPTRLSKKEMRRKELELKSMKAAAQSQMAAKQAAGTNGGSGGGGGVNDGSNAMMNATAASVSGAASNSFSVQTGSRGAGSRNPQGEAQAKGEGKNMSMNTLTSSTGSSEENVVKEISERPHRLSVTRPPSDLDDLLLEASQRGYKGKKEADNDEEEEEEEEEEEPDAAAGDGAEGEEGADEGADEGAEPEADVEAEPAAAEVAVSNVLSSEQPALSQSGAPHPPPSLSSTSPSNPTLSPPSASLALSANTTTSSSSSSNTNPNSTTASTSSSSSSSSTSHHLPPQAPPSLPFTTTSAATFSAFMLPDPLPAPNHRFIFKSNDDVRQDMLSLQIVSIFDKTLKEENLDLRMKPYKVMAFSSKPPRGLVEFVPSQSIDSILKTHGSLAAYFRKIAPDSTTPYKFKPVILENFVRSCAGYGVITYIMGVGDRHLDNLLLTDEGHLFHIDFGFFLGHDPKVRPPPMKLSKEMIDLMQGGDSEYFQSFMSYCCEAYSILRRKCANLIITLFRMMRHANIPDLKNESGILSVKNKMNFEMSEAEANNHILLKIKESASAVIPGFVDIFHRIAQSFRA
ncbi:Vacuolar protein sorting 34A (Vps34A) [Monocercomonoides exilis]|uniref:Vacuolar protein sorting 34A (Vps34A) n=1 Tax=Monocercomonoides exilis TaxID=2049356 RepID=UPI003559EA5B|nr:Vacuolar protein sorting 34A (Vps34A) [Monocercomonoides exilis]|eukprot:MONOS_2681.1-p1 / transcript=MONOS_2681.1 / gene=MONOS_2681 / organism=Monocercomonoides_exilis_PA203 / gene_product= Vacuolar protein sorting 34A (Vps34A) / transcript_product= Vacuolar protein sorting 34A (Vps34A) / location=Mono_scaffold00056:113049-121240(+) / protein_length=2395 / sequence_SO=supercontig / SO=protein_coding / is_pseudo=false